MWLGVNQTSHGKFHSRRRAGVGILLALLASLLFNATTVEAPPPLPTSDLYTHLSVARHLIRGDGFVTDVAYPLSFAHEFARRLPQPLVHRSPGYALLLTGPVLAARSDPELALRYTGWLQQVLFLLLLWVGMRAYLRRGHTLALLLWFMLLKANPLFRLALGWNMVELACALLLLVLWLRLRERDAEPTVWDGGMAGLLALLRPDLVWVPILWWLWARRGNVPSGAGFFSRRLQLALLTVLLLVTPWVVRNAVVTGNPLFSLQAEAELVKDTRTWPQYSVYKQLEPQPLAKVLREDPVPAARKFVRGLRFYGQEIGALIQVPQLAVGLLIFLWVLFGAVTRRFGPHGPAPALGSISMAVGTLGLLCVQYAPFDHSLRHLLVVLPILTWELAPVFSDNLVRIFQEMPDRIPTALRWLPQVHWRVSPLQILLALVILATPSTFPILPATGWDGAEAEAWKLAPQVAGHAAALEPDKGEVLFVDWPAVVWFADRPAVWDPGDETVRRQIRAWLTEHP